MKINGRVEEVRKRIADRRKKNDYSTSATWGKEDGNRWDHHDEEIKHELFPIRNGFILRCLISIVLVIVVAVIHSLPNEEFKSARGWIGQAVDKDFQFAKVANWFSTNTGNLYSFLPFDLNKPNDTVEQVTAIPVSGRLLESFKKNGKGIIVETVLDKNVEAIDAGVVIFVGEDLTHGKTVIVQQADGMDVWYGELQEIYVTLYEHVQKGQALGQVTPSEDGSQGEYYLAIEQDKQFIDPTKVITLE